MPELQQKLIQTGEKFPLAPSFILISIDDLLVLVNLAFAAKQVSEFGHSTDKDHQECPKCILGVHLSKIDFGDSSG